LGDDCGKDLVERTATAGRGTSTTVKDGDPNLSGLVIKALSDAMEPSFKNVKFGFNGQITKGEEIYRNRMIFQTALIEMKDYANMSFSFESTGN
jgi:hypothetical protein